ncbi:unnamed protein product [Triticum turgidum subsp. durum]|uniref:SAWADEE domain-containing protein n=1 Tax=Triticum turgidum subsp. durum TaxID=4567 RepID=A0A9R0YYF2_TRITD|nr:unnamed protein product [Triticum turgidum subsp. durum]
MTGEPPRLVFRFTHAEVAKMEEVLNEIDAMPKRPVIQGLIDHFNASPDRSGNGKVPVQYNQVRNWFHNRRSAQSQRARKMMLTPVDEEHHPVAGSYFGNISSDGGQVQFEAKSARNGAWYDVAAFLSHRFTETRDPEVLVRFTWFVPEEDEWVDVQKCVRLRSLQCVAVLPGDLILCFKEGKARYFDAQILQVQRRRHDVRGCRCRFLVCYDHDHSEECVSLSKVCRRPMHQNSQKPHKMMSVNTDTALAPLLDAPTSSCSYSVADVEMGDTEAAPNSEAANGAHDDKMNLGV